VIASLCVKGIRAPLAFRNGAQHMIIRDLIQHAFKIESLKQRMHLIALFALAGTFLFVSIGAGPNTGYQDVLESTELSQVLDPNHFRCIVVGDSQTTTPDPLRIRTQFHRWNAPFIGEQIVVGSSSSGYVVNNISITNLQYHLVDLNTGWNDGGTEDFFAPSASEWMCTADIQSPGSRIGRYRIGFGEWNVNAPFSSSWGVGVDLVARIAVRTGPGTVPALMTRAERGNQIDVSGQQVHLLDQSHGIQIVEQAIPASIDPFATRVGVGLYLPSGFVELPGQSLQILGVTITKASQSGGTPSGFMAAYQGRGGWNILDHLTRTSNLSRRALIRMTDATHVLIMLGHNKEPEGSSIYASRIQALVNEWEIAFANEGYERPTFVFVTPWPLEGAVIEEYLAQVNADLEAIADSNLKDVFVSYYDFFGGISPELQDPTVMSTLVIFKPPSILRMICTDYCFHELVFHYFDSRFQQVLLDQSRPKWDRLIIGHFSESSLRRNLYDDRIPCSSRMPLLQVKDIHQCDWKHQ
jgi:hypothetical protein